MLGVGDTAPEFEARDCQGRTVRLGDFRGRRLVLFFFPKAFTAGCTEEIRHFRDNQARIRALGGELIGIGEESERQVVLGLERQHRGRINAPRDVVLVRDRAVRALEAVGLIG